MDWGAEGVFYSQYYLFPTAGFQTENQTIKSHLQRKGTYLTSLATSKTQARAFSGVVLFPAPGRRPSAAKSERTSRPTDPEHQPLPSAQDASHSPRGSLSGHLLSAQQVSIGGSPRLCASSVLAAGAGEWVSTGPVAGDTAKITNDLKRSLFFLLKTREGGGGESRSPRDHQAGGHKISGGPRLPISRSTLTWAKGKAPGKRLSEHLTVTCRGSNVQMAPLALSRT